MSEGGDAIFSGGVSASLGKTGSFDRLEGNTLNKISHHFFISPMFHKSKTGSDGSDLQIPLKVYHTWWNTGSLGLLTLGNDITGSIIYIRVLTPGTIKSDTSCNFKLIIL